MNKRFSLASFLALVLLLLVASKQYLGRKKEIGGKQVNGKILV
jgi:hypothetical protein